MVVSYNFRRPSIVVFLIVGIAILSLPLWITFFRLELPTRNDEVTLLGQNAGGSSLISKTYLPDTITQSSNTMMTTTTMMMTTIHVLYGLSGNTSEFLQEFQVSLKSVLLNSPMNYALTIHILADQNAFQALPIVLERTAIGTWQTRNPLQLRVYNIQSRIPHWEHFLETKTRYKAGYYTKHHTIGTFFRLFVHDVVDPAEVRHVIYLDTDVLIMAPFARLWNMADPSTIFAWGVLECAGFILLTVPRLELFWEIASSIDIVTFGKQVRAKPTDQLLLRAVNKTHPELVTTLPPEWDVPLAHGLWKGSLRNHRPNGIGSMHLNGAKKSNINVFVSSSVLLSESPDKQETWGLALYYARIPWPWVKFIVEHMNDRPSSGNNVTIEWNVITNDSPEIGFFRPHGSFQSSPLNPVEPYT